MTQPAPRHDRVGDLVVTPATPVLLNRPLHVDAAMPLFGHARWDISAALPDRHSAGQALLWHAYPEPLRESCKLYAFALINIVDDPPQMPRSRATVPHIKTIWSDLGKLRVFLHWLISRGITALNHVTVADLDAYLRHVTDNTTASTDWKRTMLLAVQRLHLYRDTLPERCRLPADPLWGNASAAQLVGHEGPWFSENRTHRIHPDVMQPLLSAALLVTDTIAADLLPTARSLLAMRRLAHQVAPDIRRARTRSTVAHDVVRQHTPHLLAGLHNAGMSLPGKKDGTRTVVDLVGLSIGGWLNHSILIKNRAARTAIETSQLPITPNLLRVTRFTEINGTPWRDRALDAAELATMLRHLTAACFLVIAYLSGVRTGEALNLRRGCISRDRKLGLTFMSGQQLKVGDDRRERSPQTIPWVVTDHTAQAVSVLEQLTVGQLLFPAAEFGSQERFLRGDTRTRTPRSTTTDITAFITWFNSEIADTVGHPRIGVDSNGKIHPQRLRRTLAWHIVRRPGGTIAGATQYGHLHHQLIQGYAGGADSGFLDEITFEQFLQRAETIHDDHQKLQNGEHVSGPAAQEYRRRVSDGSRFAGLTITTTSQVNNALANPALQIHHGALLTCVYREASAACRDDTDAGSGPAWSRCRLSCSNAARTDRDIAELRDHVRSLAADLQAPGIPHPLRQRIHDRLTEHQRAIAEHDNTRPPTSTTEPKETR